MNDLSWMEAFALERFIFIQDLESPLCVPLCCCTHRHTHTGPRQSAHGVEVNTAVRNPNEWKHGHAHTLLFTYKGSCSYGECIPKQMCKRHQHNTQQTFDSLDTHTHTPFIFVFMFGLERAKMSVTCTHHITQLNWNSTFSRSVAMQMQLKRNFR